MTKTADVGRAERRARQVMRRLFVVGALLIGSDSASMAQETRSPNGSVLRAEFAEKLGDPELNDPTDEGLAAAEERDTDYAQYDACRWQEIVLTRPFAAACFRGGEAREKGKEFTPAVSPGGYDSVYYRWETDLAGLPGATDYSLQFRCTRWMMSVMAEPKSPAVRPKLSEEEVRQRVATALTDIVNCGPQLLAHSTMRLERAPYGYCISFHQTVEQAEALHGEKRARVYAIGYDPGDEWLKFLKIRTDGYSFVFDLPKIGIGSTRPSPTTTTQPTDKTWFEERKPLKPALQ